MFSSLYHRAWTFSEIRIINPHVNVVVEAEGRWNLSGLIKQRGPERMPPEPAQAGRAPGLLIGQAALRGGSVGFIDRRAGAQAEVRLGSLPLDVEELSTLPGRTGKKYPPPAA